MTGHEILQQAIGTFGEHAQEQMLLEEMSELQREAIAEAIASVEIMLDQMKLIFRCGHEVSVHRCRKLQRLEGRLRGE